MSTRFRTSFLIFLLLLGLPLLIGQTSNRADDPQPGDGSVSKPASAAEVARQTLPAVATFPKLTGTLTELIGHTNGYIPPKKGLPVQIDFAELARTFEELQADPETRQRAGAIEFGVNDDEHKLVDGYGYIPISGPFELRDVHYYGNGFFESARFVSDSKENPGSHRITLDITNHGGPRHDLGNDTARIWIVVESRGRTSCVAVIDCKSDGAFPVEKP